MLCPFCGKETVTTELCSHCGVRFTKEIRTVAWDEPPCEDRIGPFSTKVAKRLLYVAILLLLIAFFALTEAQGNGILSMR